MPELYIISVFTCVVSHKTRYREDRLPSFLANKASMMDDLEKQGWPVDPEDINLLEREIEQAQTFLTQSKDLRQKSEEV